MAKVEVIQSKNAGTPNYVWVGIIIVAIVIGVSVGAVNYFSNENNSNNGSNSSTSLPSNIQGIYVNAGMRGKTNICDTIAFKLNSTTVQHQLFSQSLGCTKDFNFDSKAVVYNIQNIKKIGSSGEDYYFELYSNGTKEYECNRVFGSMSCTSKSGTSLSYKQYND